ncbi:MAG: hypothetical protein ACRCVA_03305, partial [Phreatobacter sp.]
GEAVRNPARVPADAIALRDGIAVAAASLVGASPYAPVILAEAPSPILAGQVLPPATDAVIPAAAATRSGAFVEIGQAAYPGEQVALAGSDLAPDALILGYGATVTPEIRLALAMAGIAEIAVLNGRFAIASSGHPATRDWLAARLGALGLIEDRPAEADLTLCLGESDAPGVDPASSHAIRGLALRPGEAAGTALLADGRPVIRLPGRFDGAVAAFYALVLPVAARLTARAIDTRTLPLAAKISSAIGCTDVALLRVVGESYEPVSVGQIALQALLKADAIALIPPESEGAGAGTPLAAIPIDTPLMPGSSA